MAGGTSSYNGRVEVFTMGQWGTICDDWWSLNNADTACRQLGFPFGASEAISGFGGGTGPIWLDNLACGAYTQIIFNCYSPNQVGVHNCDHTEDAGLTCIPIRKSNLVKLTCCAI